MIKKSEITPKNIIAYIQGNVRYFLYYKPILKWLIRKHIREQIEYRINSMDRECYNMGSCKLCGCKTTALQMANKACDKPCYPEMFGRKTWKKIKEEYIFVTLTEDMSYLIWGIDDENKKFIVINNE